MNFLTQHRKTIIIGAVALLVVFLLWYGIKPDKVQAYSVFNQDYVPSLLLSGEVIAESSTLLSVLSSGTVIECPAGKGDKVTKGQLLIQLDDAQARVDRDRAAAAVQIAQAQLQKAGTVNLQEALANSTQAELGLEKAEQGYDRISTLAGAGAVSSSELEQAERDLKMAQELVRSSRAMVESLEENGASIVILQAELQQRQLDLDEKEIILDRFKIIAPADGELLDIYVRPGESVTSGSSAALLAAGEGLRIKIQPDQRYAALAAVGNKAQVWATNEPNSKWDAHVACTEPSGNAEQGSFTAELELDTNVGQLYPGQLLSVQLFGPLQPEAVILPDSYLAVEMGQSGVWLAIDNRAHFSPLQIGLRTEDGIVISAGLMEGDQVLKPEGLKENKRVLPQTGTI